MDSRAQLRRVFVRHKRVYLTLAFVDACEEVIYLLGERRLTGVDPLARRSVRLRVPRHHTTPCARIAAIWSSSYPSD